MCFASWAHLPAVRACAEIICVLARGCPPSGCVTALRASIQPSDDQHTSGFQAVAGVKNTQVRVSWGDTSALLESVSEGGEAARFPGAHLGLPSMLAGLPTVAFPVLPLAPKHGSTRAPKVRMAPSPPPSTTSPSPAWPSLLRPPLLPRIRRPISSNRKQGVDHPRQQEHGRPCSLPIRALPPSRSPLCVSLTFQVDCIP